MFIKTQIKSYIIYLHIIYHSVAIDHAVKALFVTGTIFRSFVTYGQALGFNLQLKMINTQQHNNLS